MLARRSTSRFFSTQHLGAALVATALVAVAPHGVAAQWELGPQVQYNNVLGGTWAVGARVNYQAARTFQIQATGDYYFADCGSVGDCSLWDFQLNGIFFLTRQQAYEPYLGAGLSIQPFDLSGAINDSGTATGPVVFIGSTLGFWGRTQPFVEGKWLFKGKDLSTQFAIEFGFIVELGARR